jgi:hypothetical protein
MKLFARPDHSLGLVVDGRNACLQWLSVNP